MFLVSGSVIFLFNVLLSLAYGWAIADQPLAVRLALVSFPVTAIVTWVGMPTAARLLRTWLFAPARGRRASSSRTSPTRSTGR